MIKTYIYPTYTPSRDKSGNLYIKYFHEAFDQDASYKVVNRFWQIGIASLLFNLDAKLLIIQWVDLIPGKKFGKIQFVFYLCLIFFARLLGKKIVWVLHNKHAHKGKSRLVDFGMKFMAKRASSVVAHSEEGVSFFDMMYPEYAGKCFYIPHPVYRTNIIESSPSKFDYIIWGGIGRRKNITQFLDEFNLNPLFKGNKLIICGFCGDKEYDAEIRKRLNENIVYSNKFHSDEELSDLIKQSKNILFTYDTGSMLSSGALVFSLNFAKPIIGPNAGNFKDLKDVVSCYNSFNEIPLLKPSDNRCLVERYLIENTWERFPEKMMKLLNG